MANSPTDLTIHRFSGRDGVALVWHELGPADGRPLVLIHGLFSNAQVNWIKYGHAARLAEAGHRVIMPDLRGHGDSAKPHEAIAYPPDVLADDGFSLLDALGLAAGAFDLGGYSLGGRTVVRLLARGAQPRRAIVAGMGLDGLLNTARRGGHFRAVLEGLGTHQRGSPAFMAEAFLKSTGGDPAALLPLLGSFVETPLETIAAISVPVLALTGRDDHDNGSAAELAQALPEGYLVEIPGNHMSAVMQPELSAAMIDFLR